MSGDPWHNVSPGKNIPFSVTAVVEIPKGSKSKYEVDKHSGMLMLDRVLFSSVIYPANYGFIPGTYSDDKDPLDILVICSVELVPLCLVEATVIGVMHMVDNNEKDDKIIAVAAHDMSVNYIQDIKDLPPHTEKEIIRFFEDYKKLEHSNVVVEQFLGKDEAYGIINQSIDMYQKMFNK